MTFARYLAMFKDIILKPTDVFRRTKTCENMEEVIIIFGIAASTTFLKSFNFKKKYITFYANDKLNDWLSILAIPQIKLTITYLAYFLLVSFHPET